MESCRGLKPTAIHGLPFQGNLIALRNIQSEPEMARLVCPDTFEEHDVDDRRPVESFHGALVSGVLPNLLYELASG